MNRLFLSLITVAAGITTLTAAKVAQVTINGSPVQKAVASVCFNGDKLTIQFDDATSAEADMNDVSLSFIEGGPSTSVGSIGNLSIFTYEGIIGETLSVSGIQGNTNLTIYDLNGKTMIGPLPSAERMEINVSGLTPGVYVLRAGNDVVKFVKR